MPCFLKPEHHLIEGLLIDMDGVLYHGDVPIDASLSFMNAIVDIPHVFITNNPIRLPEKIIEKLDFLGFDKPGLNQVITSGEVCAAWLNKQKPEFKYFAIGAEGLHQSLQKFGTEDHLNADYVVIGEGDGIDYENLSIAINLILKRGAQLISTNPDNTVDATRDGQHWVLPGGGALVAPLVVATGVEPITIGKPFPLLYEMALERLNIAPENALMIGDRPDTDIHGAAKLGIKTALVRTGRFLPGESYPANLNMPDIDVDSLDELQAYLDFQMN